MERVLACLLLAASLQSTMVFAQSERVIQAIRQACRAELDAHFDAEVRKNNGRPAPGVTRENFRGNVGDHYACGPSAELTRDIREIEKKVAEYTEKRAQARSEFDITHFNLLAMHYNQILCVTRWFDTPHCKAVKGTAPAAGVVASAKPAAPAASVSVEVKTVRSFGNGCVTISHKETKEIPAHPVPVMVETTVELKNTCAQEQKFVTLESLSDPYVGFFIWSRPMWMAQNFPIVAMGPGYQLWQTYMPLPKGLGYIPAIAQMDWSARIPKDGIAHMTVIQPKDQLRPIGLKVGSCDYFVKKGEQNLVLAEINLDNFQCRPAPNKAEIDKISKHGREGILLAQERQVKATQDRGGKGKRHARAAEANDCIKLHGNGGTGGFTNACAYPVELHYCAAQPASGTLGREVDCEATNGAGARLGAGVSYEAPIKGAQQVYWFACKNQAIPVDVEYTRGQGLQGRCHAPS